MAQPIHQSDITDAKHQWVLAGPPEARSLRSGPGSIPKYEGTYVQWICHCGASKVVRLSDDDRTEPAEGSR
jgi:hypothetical protein